MSDLFLSGLNLAMYGMGFVFTFLVLLVLVTILMSLLVRRFSSNVHIAPRYQSADQKAGNLRRTGLKADVQLHDDEKRRLVAVISAALKQHRSNSD
jgi:oxaloacetate decarboxylase gamma subunit